MGTARIRDESSDPFERTLLASARCDALGDDRKRALLATLAVAAPPAGSPSSKESRGVVAAKWAGAAAKWIVSALIVGAAAFTLRATGAFRSRVSPAASVASVASAEAQPAPREALPPSVASTASDPAELAPSDTPPLGAPSFGLPHESAGTAASSRPALALRRAPAPPSIAEELKLIEEANRAVNAGNARAAHVALERYQRTFPSGVLAEEATVLGIRVLALDGERDRAATQAQTFLRAHPRSAHAASLRPLAGSLP